MESALSSLTIRRLLQEIREEVEGKYLNKVQQLDEDTYRFRFSPGSEDLIIEPGKRINITDYRLKAPKKAKQSSMLLRKHLSNSRLEEIEQVAFDRVVEMRFTNEKRIVVELFGEGNLILTDEENKILYVHERKEWKDRKLRRGEEYSYPPSDMVNPFEMNFETFENILKEDKIVVTLARDLGLGGDLSEEICRETEIDKGSKGEEISEKEARSIFNELKNIIEKEDDPVKQGNKIRPFPLSEEVEERYESLNEAVDDNYTEKETKSEKPSKIIKLEKRLESQRESLKEFKKNSKRYKKKGDKIYENYSKVSKSIQLYKKGEEEEIEGLGAKVKDDKIEFDLD